MPAPALRLTRRGRWAVGVLAVVASLLLAVAGLVIGGTARADGEARAVPVSWVVVRPGQTLWQIAGAVAPRADRRDTVSRIVELNALPNSAVQAGQRIAVPPPGG